jgi:replication-associated recombination protein RarA
VLWGPPGTGKTTIAQLIARRVDAHFVSVSAVLSGVKEIRAAIEEARQMAAEAGRRTVVFVDEVHRFNKSQQDAFLPHIEDGTITFVGATTENPAFELNNALLSRLRVYVLRSLDSEASCFFKALPASASASRRKATDKRRICSTKANAASPSCSRITSPKMRPNQRMSSTRGRSARLRVPESGRERLDAAGLDMGLTGLIKGKP